MNKKNQQTQKELHPCLWHWKWFKNGWDLSVPPQLHSCVILSDHSYLQPPTWVLDLFKKNNTKTIWLLNIDVWVYSNWVLSFSITAHADTVWPPLNHWERHLVLLVEEPMFFWDYPNNILETLQYVTVCLIMWGKRMKKKPQHRLRCFALSRSTEKKTNPTLKKRHSHTDPENGCKPLKIMKLRTFSLLGMQCGSSKKGRQIVSSNANWGPHVTR